MVKERRLITSALPYTNNVPHVGNIVGSHLPADIFARYCRAVSYDTVFIGGTDEHGTASEIAAQKNNLTPKELCDFFYQIHKEIYEWFEISYDNFSRTSRPIHHKTTQEFFKAVQKNGYITEEELDLPFCLTCKRQLADRYIEGSCPYCGNEKARGDQCEKCGNLLDPIKLKDPYCTVCHTKNIEFRKSKHLFIKLDKLSSKIEKWIKSNKQLRPQVKNLALGWINEGLNPRCITRDLKWGVPIPFKGYEDKVFYCWFDAPIGYISSTREWSEKKWKLYWQGKAKIYQFLGKDNIAFHTIFFPGMLIANGNLNLPYNVVGLQYLNYENSKFSKSQNHGVFCENLPSAGLNADYWRFYLSFIIPEVRDTEFLWKEFQERVNTELVGNLGNFINRTLSFTQSKYQGIIPKAILGKKEKVFLVKVNKRTKKIKSLLEDVHLREGLEEILAISHDANKFFQDNEPWKNPEKSKQVVLACLNVVRTLGLLTMPYLPAASKKVLGFVKSEETDWKKLEKFTLKPGLKLNSPEIIFRNIEDSELQRLKEKCSKVTEYFSERKKEDVEMKKKEEAKVELDTCVACDTVPFEEFKKLDIRIGKIIKAEQHPNADKLYILLIDLGHYGEDRQVVAGLRAHYKIEELVGKNVVMVVNLQPAVIRGVESNGMILAAGNKDNVYILQPEKDIVLGAKVQ